MRIYGSSAVSSPRIDTTNALKSLAGSERLLPSYDAVANAYIDLPCDIEVRRSVTIVYDPKPNEGFSDLDIQGGGDLPGLGVFKMLHFSNLVSRWLSIQLMTVVRRRAGQNPAGIPRPFALGHDLRRPALLDPESHSDIASEPRHEGYRP